MNLPVFISPRAAEGAGLVTPAYLASRVDVDRRQIFTWSVRRYKNDFPDRKGVLKMGGRDYPLYLLSEFLVWHRRYTTSTAVDSVHVPVVE